MPTEPMETERFIEIMEGAKAYLHEHGWVQGSLIGAAGAVCASGAIAMTVYDGDFVGLTHDRWVMEGHSSRYYDWLSACRLAANVIPGDPFSNIATFNDSPGVTMADVVDLFDRAIIYKKEHPDA